MKYFVTVTLPKYFDFTSLKIGTCISLVNEDLTMLKRLKPQLTKRIEIAPVVVFQEHAEVFRENIIPNDFCVCCSPAILICAKKSKIYLDGIPDTGEFITIK